ALWSAFPTSDYYGDSVSLGLAPGRTSRVPRPFDVQDGCRCPVRVLEMADATHSPSECWPTRPTLVGIARGYRTSTTVSGPYIFGLGTGVQPMQASPYRPDLARPRAWWLRSCRASRICYCPLRLSPSGRSDDPGGRTHLLPRYTGIERA